MLPTSFTALDRDDATRGRACAHAGDLVQTREALWRVTHVRDGTRDVRVVSLRGADDRNRWQECTLLEPFDRLLPRAAASRPRVVSRRRWMRALRQLAGSADAVMETAMGLEALAEARVALLPHQLEPLLAILDGVASRVLIADGVGLGKTIQAALALRVLAARGEAARVLIVVPAGLREQWQRELRARVGLESHIIDANTLGARARELPADINPWSQPGIIITSLDFIKQEIVLHGVAAIVWDVLIVDEAHALAPGTDRATAADHLARHSRIVLLLTATPHDGTDTSFDALCRIGYHATAGAADPIAIFHRSRRSLGVPAARRVHVLRVQPTPAERHLHDLLARYTTRVEREHHVDEPAALAMTVLRKRACSSAWSLLQSLERRLILLSPTDAPPPPPAQRALPFDVAAPATNDAPNPDADNDTDADADAAPRTVLAAPGLPNSHNERAWLSLLIHAARRAVRRESKLRALHRLLRRVHEPAIIYTEYRDTLTHILDTLPNALPDARSDLPPRGRADAIATLHGGLSRDAREASLHRFATGAARLLLATDAAGEGLNLQHRCRLVINIELPWNPNRLEQRLGRVDRLGQSRTVHAIHLVLTGTPEEPLLHTLTSRATHITNSLTTARDPAARDLAAREPAAREPCPAPAPPHHTAAPEHTWPDLRPEASEAVRTLEHLRLLRAAPTARLPNRLRAVRTDATMETPERPRHPPERLRDLHAGAAVRTSERLRVSRADAADATGGADALPAEDGSGRDLEMELDERSPWVATARRCRHRGPLADLGLAPGLLCIWRTRVRTCITDSTTCMARALITPLHVSMLPAPADAWPIRAGVMAEMRHRLDALARTAIERWREDERALCERAAARRLAIHDAMQALCERDAEQQPPLFVDIAADPPGEPGHPVARDIHPVARWRAPPLESAPEAAAANSRGPAPPFEHTLVLLLVIP